VRVLSEPSGADIFVDGRRIGKTPFEETVPRRPDKRSYVLKKAGHASTTLSLETSADQERTVILRRKEPSAALPAASSSQPADKDAVNPFE
jgi:hypothetical protein